VRRLCGLCAAVLLLFSLTGCGEKKTTPQTPEEQRVIVCMGDSLTEGDYGTTTHGISDVHKQGYPYYLAQFLHCKTVNAGKCGYTVQQYLDYYRQGSVDVSQADVVLIMLGTNEGLTLSGTENREAYQALIDDIRSRLKESACLVLVTPPHATEDDTKTNYGYAPAVENTRTVVWELGIKNNLPVIDAYAESPIQPDREDEYQPVDGLHLGREGYRAFAWYMGETLSEMTGWWNINS